jgi:hypothetical protein
VTQFDYTIAGVTVTVIVDDAILVEAQGDLHSIETAAKSAIDAGRPTGTVFSRRFLLTDIPAPPQHTALPYLRMLFV